MLFILSLSLSLVRSDDINFAISIDLNQSGRERSSADPAKFVINDVRTGSDKE